MSSQSLPASPAPGHLPVLCGLSARTCPGHLTQGPSHHTGPVCLISFLARVSRCIHEQDVVRASFMGEEHRLTFSHPIAAAFEKALRQSKKGQCRVTHKRPHNFVSPRGAGGVREPRGQGWRGGGRRRQVWQRGGWEAAGARPCHADLHRPRTGTDVLKNR